MQIKGVGKVTAWTVVAFLGEIDRLTRNQIVSLAGLAPFNRDSGAFKGKRKVIGGRGKVRAALYMATHTAAMHNPVIKQYVDGLLSRGKPYKCAIVAGMRKMLIHMQSELKNLKLYEINLNCIDLVAQLIHCLGHGKTTNYTCWTFKSG